MAVVIGQRRTPGEGIHLLFRVMAVAALVAAFAQVTLGGVVRATGSGLGCPDWPLCHGQIIPPFQTDTLIEYSHRLSASALSVLALVTAGLAWMYYRSNTWILRGSVAALALVAVAAILGGATVLTELAWWLRLLHLAIAEALVAALVVVIVAGRRETEQAFPSERYADDAKRFNTLILATIIGVFVLILSGSYMVGYGAGTSCATWPLCRGELFPQGMAYAIHMGHRMLSVLVGALVLATAVAAFSRGLRLPSLRWTGVTLAAVFAAQVLVGAWTVWAGFSAEMKALHLSFATLVWVALSFLAAIAYSRQGFGFRNVEPAGGSAPGLERLTP